MSFHDHEGEEYNRRFGVHERQKEEQKKKRDEQLVGNSAQSDHFIPLQTDHLFPGQTDHRIPEQIDHYFSASN